MPLPFRLRVRSASVLAFACGTLFLLSGLRGVAQTAQSFTCGEGKSGAQRLTSSSRFKDANPGFGFDLVVSPTRFTKGSCASDEPFFFSVTEPDGNYQVKLVLGGSESSVTTVRAESRRLFIDRMDVPAGAPKTVVFDVNVRTETIAGAAPDQDKVKLKPREVGALDWDNKLTLEFNGTHPTIRSISVKPITGVPVVYLAGDSTVVDQDKEPWAAWGQMLPVFFGPDVVIANEAESGETIRSFTSERRLAKILSTIKPGDYLLIQFAHNDQKAGTPEQTDFKGYLKRYVDAAREHGASAILVTSMNRRTFAADGTITDTLGGYPQAMREFAATEHLPLIDLNALSKTLFTAMGPDGTLRAFVHYPANTFPGQTDELKDDTHFNSYGAYELARAVVESIKDQRLALAVYLRKNIPAFDPAHPDAVADFNLPQSPLVSTEKPYGK